MKKLLVGLFFFGTFGCLFSQNEWIIGKWEPNGTFSRTVFEYDDIWIFREDSLFISHIGPIGSDATWEKGCYRLEKDTIFFEVIEHAWMSLNTGYAKHFKNKPFVTKIPFMKDSEKLIYFVTQDNMTHSSIENIGHPLYWLEKCSDETIIEWDFSQFKDHHWIEKDF